MSVPVIVVSREEDHEASINRALRDAGHAAHCLRLPNLADFSRALEDHRPELILLLDRGDLSDLEQASQHCRSFGARIPLLLVADTVDEASIAKAMAAGARDVVSLGNIERLQAVATRELRNYQLETTLTRVMSSANQYKLELDSLKRITVEAIADVQEGIIVNANPAWLELFGYERDAEISGIPIMDLCSKTDQPALKGGIVACQRGKWMDDKLEINGFSANGNEFPVSLFLENIEFDSEPAVRMLVKPDAPDQQPSVSVVEQAFNCDPVTGFYNRAFFLSQAEQRMGDEPQGGIRALAYLRIDRFSHAANDIGTVGTENIILQFSRLLRDFIQPNDIFGRFGGTMFVVLLERGTLSDSEAWATQFLKTVKAAVFEFEKRTTMLTCSIGLCAANQEFNTLNALLNESEQACRAARQKGGNTIARNTPAGGTEKQQLEESIWVPKIRGALMENRFRLEHQPIAELNGEMDEGYDILVRMLDEEGNTVLPSEFMPAAERTGLTKNIDRWVIGASISFCVTNSPQLVFVRLSRDSVLDESLPAWLQTQIERNQLTPSRLCFEIDEKVASQHLTQVQQLSGQLGEMGFRFALEHCGINGDCEQLISKLRMQFMKIDGSLMQGLHKNAELQARVKQLVTCAQSQGIETLAERVQDANTMAVLWQLGVSYIQGNYVAKREIVLEDTTHSTSTTRALNAMA